MDNQIDVKALVEDIHKDLASVKWNNTTDVVKKIAEMGQFSTFNGTGDRWGHNLITWEEDGVVRCDGSAVMLSSPLIVRYTPELAQLAAKAAKGAK